MNEEPSLFVQGRVVTPGPKTPAIAIEENEEFFLSNKTSYFDIKVVQTNNPPTSVPNDPHSPVWGRGAFTQPKSRAESPPSASILKHSKQRVKSMRSKRLDSSTKSVEHDPAIKSAKWLVQPAEQGNGGLRNAVNAASRLGSLAEKTWVS